MYIQRINITLPIDILKELQKAVPQGKRSKFIADAVFSKLKNKNIQSELKKSLKRNMEVYAQIDREWQVTELETWPK